MMPHTLCDVLDDLGFGWCQLRLAFLAGGIYAIAGEVLFLFAIFPGAISRELNLDSYERASVGSVVFAGMLVGNLACCANDYFGRRVPLLLAMLGMLIFVYASTFAYSLYSLLVLWGLTGLGYGVGVPTWNALCSETTPTNRRFLVNAVSMSVFPLGSLFGAFLVFLYAPDLTSVHDHWRQILALGRIPHAILLVLGIYPGFVDSAHFLAEKGRLTEAQQQLSEMKRQNGCPDVSIDFVPSVRVDVVGVHQFPVQALVTRDFLPTTAVLCFTTFMLNFMCFGSMYSLPHILQSVDLGMSPALSLMLATMCEIVGYMMGFGLERITGRRQILMMYLSLSIVFTGVFLQGVFLLQDNSKSSVGRGFVQTGINGKRLISPFGWSVAYVYIGEAFPTFARASASGVCIGVGRLGALVSPWIFEHLLLTTGSYNWFFVLSVLGSIINILLAGCVLQETKGQRLYSHPGATEAAIEFAPQSHL